jgi:hypothetical protein
MDGSPYTPVQLEQIRNCVETKHDVVERIVVEAANDYLRSLNAPPLQRSNPAREIAAFRAALQSMVAALDGLSARSRAILDNLRQPPGPADAGREAMDCAALTNAVHLYLIENAAGLNAEIEDGARPGRPKVSEKRHLLDRWDRAFLIGHGGVLPSRGRPTFLKLCASPAVLRLNDVGGDWWEDLHRKNTRRK